MTEDEAKELKVGDRLKETDYDTIVLVEQVKERGLVMIIEDFERLGPHRHFRDFSGLETYTKIE